MYYIIVILAGLMLFSFWLSYKDIFSVVFILFVGYFIAAISALYNALAWGLTIQPKLIMILSVGWFFALIAECFARYIFYHGVNKVIDQPHDVSIIQISYLKILFIITVNMVVTLVLIKELQRIGGGSLLAGTLASGYKQHQYEMQMSGTVTQIAKVTKGSAFVLGFVGINNIVANRRESRLKSFMLFVPGALYCVQSIFRGGRYTVIAYLLGMAFFYYYLMQYKSGWKYQMKFGRLVKILLAAVLIVFGFWAIRFFVGRTDESGLIDYITRYLGGPYALFNLYLKNPPEKKIETFAYLMESINKIFGTNIATRTYPEFRFSNTGIMVGNVYSGMRTYYNDFGLIGVAAFSFLFSFILNMIYMRIISYKNIYSHMFLPIFYASVIYAAFFHFFAEYFFARFSVGYVVEVLIMYLIYIFVFKIRFVISR